MLGRCQAICIPIYGIYWHNISRRRLGASGERLTKHDHDLTPYCLLIKKDHVILLISHKKTLKFFQIPLSHFLCSVIMFAPSQSPPVCRQLFCFVFLYVVSSLLSVISFANSSSSLLCYRYLYFIFSTHVSSPPLCLCLLWFVFSSSMPRPLPCRHLIFFIFLSVVSSPLVCFLLLCFVASSRMC